MVKGWDQTARHNKSNVEYKVQKNILPVKWHQEYLGLAENSRNAKVKSKADSTVNAKIFNFS